MERNKCFRRYKRQKERYIYRRKRRHWVNPGRTSSWWDNLYNEKMIEDEWRNNLRMDKESFFELVAILEPYLMPDEGVVRQDYLTVEKQVGMCLYYLKDQGSYRMTCNAFGISVPSLSIVLRKFCAAMMEVGKTFIRLPKDNEETQNIMNAFESKFAFPQVFGCIDGTHIPIKRPTENPQDYFCYKMKYLLNVQAICDEKGMFLDVDTRWPGSVHDAKVYKNSLINELFQKKKFPGNFRTLLDGLNPVPPLLLADPAYPLLSNVMKVLFNEMLRSARNQIECAFGRLKARWRINTHEGHGR